MTCVSVKIAPAGSVSLTDPYFSNVTLLLKGNGSNGGTNSAFVDSSANNYSITRNGSPTQGTISPFLDNWSAYFNGAGDSVTSPSNTAFDFGTGNFTIDGWFNASNTTPSLAMVGTRFGDAGTSIHWCVYLSSGGFLSCDIWNTSTVRIGLFSHQTSVSPNTWNHFALVRNGSTFTLYLNGVASTTTATSSTAIANTNTSIKIGNYPGSAIASFAGYLSNIRIVKGVALYTSNFAPPTGKATSVAGTTLLTLQDNRFKDNSANNFTLTPGGSIFINSISPFGNSVNGGSGYLDGASSLSMTGPNLSSNWTVEFWAYPTTSGTQQTMLSMNNAGPAGLNIWRNPSNQLVVDDGANAQGAFTGKTITPGAWNHIAVVKNGSTVTGYINGSVAGTNAMTPSTISSVLIGRYNNASNFYFAGYLSDVRVTNGSAVYTSAFTPPTTPQSPISGTSLLLKFENGQIVDSKCNVMLFPQGADAISTSIKKYGSGSIYGPNQSVDYLSALNSRDSFRFTGDFTIEAWVYKATSGDGSIIILDNGATNYFGINAETTYRVYLNNGGSPSYTIGTIPMNTWFHAALVRSGSTVKVFHNGVLIGSTTKTGTLGYSSPSWVHIGGGLTAQMYFDDVRVTNGVARYSSNFTPPTAELPTL